MRSTLRMASCFTGPVTSPGNTRSSADRNAARSAPGRSRRTYALGVDSGVTCAVQSGATTAPIPGLDVMVSLMSAVPTTVRRDGAELVEGRTSTGANGDAESAHG